MASMHSITLDDEGCSHYYHCVISRVPATMPLQMVSSFVVPNPNSPIVAELEALGCRIVPHKLHTFKENLPTKFGFVTYFIHHKADGTRDDEAMHRLFVQWATTELPKQTECDVQIRLAQPTNCCQAGPFLRHMHSTCKLLSAASGVQDVKKMETFILANVKFVEIIEEPGSPSIKTVARVDEWGVVGTIEPETIPAVDLGWLRKEVPTVFPEKADVASLRTFFAEMLAPLFAVVDNE